MRACNSIWRANRHGTGLERQAVGTLAAGQDRISWPLAGVIVALKPRYGAYVVAGWLAGIIINLLTYSGFYDVALRDFGLMLGASALARLAAAHERRDQIDDLDPSLEDLDLRRQLAEIRRVAVDRPALGGVDALFALVDRLAERLAGDAEPVDLGQRIGDPPLDHRRERADGPARADQPAAHSGHPAVPGKLLGQVDCQHRLGYLGDLAVELPFMSFIGLTEREEMLENGIRLNAIGNLGRLPSLVRAVLDAREATLRERAQ